MWKMLKLSQVTSVDSSFQSIVCHLLEMNHDSRRGSHPDTLIPWILHERILFLPASNQRARLLDQLGDICSKRWEGSQIISHLKQAIYAYIDAVRDDPKNVTYLQDLGIALFCRFEALGEISDINRAVSIEEDAVCLTLDGDPEKPRRLNNLGSSLLARFKRCGDLSDLNKSISSMEESVHLTSDGHPDKPTALNNVGNGLLARFQRLGDLSDLNGGISKMEESVHLTPVGHPNRPSWLNNLGSSLQARFERLGDVSDLDESISRKKDAVHLTPDGHPRRPTWLTNLGNSLLARFEQLGDINDLNESISRMENAVCLIPDGHPDKLGMVNNLGNSLLARFERLGDISDLNDSIAKKKDAVQLTPDGHPRRATWLTNLGSSLLARFERLGDISDLNESISRMEIAVCLIPDGHPDKPGMVNNLGNSLLARFKKLGDLSDLNTSISRMEDAVRLTPDGHPEKHGRLNNLGNSLQAQFERLGDISDLNHSISKYKDAVQLTPVGHPDRPSWLNNLGNSLLDRFDRLGDISDLNESISRMEESVRLTEVGHPNRPSWLNNLGNSLLARFKKLGDLSDLNTSISKMEDAVRLTPDGHPEKPGRLNNLGNGLLHHFEKSQNLRDSREAIRRYTAAACSPIGPAHVRFHAAKIWAHSAEMIQHPSILEGYTVALNLLPEVAWLGLSISDRHHQIMKAGTVVRDAASAAILSGQPKKAVEWLEQGRSIIWGQMLNLRSPVDILKEKFPELAKEFIAVSTQLEGAITRGSNGQIRDSGSPESLSTVAHRAHENAHERDLLLTKIRELEGFQQFLLPKTISELSLAAQKGPVVFLTVSKSSCDALALLPDLTEEVVRVSLPEFTPDHVNNLAKLFQHLLPYMGRGDIDRLHGRHEGGSAGIEEDFVDILSELWIRLIKPVLDALAITTPTKKNLKHIWWCPTGPLTFLPIHAAGLYGKNDAFGSKLSDFVISSYTPSLAALIRGFRPPSKSEQGLQLLAIAQPSAGGQSRIPGTTDEIQRIQECARDKIPVQSLVEHEATVARVEEGMTKSAFVHFACHGVQDVYNPTKSALFLAGSSRLTLERIIQLSLPNTDLAFLSACQTATGDKQLQEESVHLAAGMLLAGCRGVIATMWSIMDSDAPQVAADVYEHLFKMSPLDPTRAAEALHLTIQNLREGSDSEGKKKSFFDWVPFIHLGV